ncbi:MAG: hypothetical protein A2005_09080 [Desulfuromonadales bacterium GWC2_61_20]|nr:MAG: hypothetical protein A2005_09080 [Desulfuromonadales bacterium GWC2_61_20]
MSEAYRELLAESAGGAVILTVNKRLARSLLTRFDEGQAAGGKVVWKRPAILPWRAWVFAQLESSEDDARRLSPVQEIHLWEEVIADDLAARGHSLMQIPAAARRAAEAHGLLAAYETDFRADEGGLDQLAFLRWRAAFRQRLQKEGWSDGAAAVRQICDRLAHGRLKLPAVIRFAGFDTMTPELTSLRHSLSVAGVAVRDWQPTSRSGRVGVVACLDAEDEVRRCARWIRHICEGDPAATVGVVAPQLARYQPLITSIFRAELDPQAVIRGAEAEGAFGLSLGAPLAREGVIGAALRLLTVGGQLSLDEASWLLRTPYLGGGQSEQGARARADREVRRRRRPEWRLARLRRDLESRRDLPQFQRILAGLAADLEAGGKQQPGRWAERFADLLETLGWPGERSLSSREFQAVTSFKAVLCQLASLDRVAGRVDRSAAVGLLQRLTSETLFQPEGGEGPIQVLGMLEAGGGSFQHLWLLGAHDGALPQPPRPNPFLPVALQRRSGMPRADAGHEFHFAEQLLLRLRQAADEVIISWPQREEGVSLRPSPLLHGDPPVEPTLAPSADPIQLYWAARPLLEALVDERAPAISPHSTVSGGTNLIKDQALCPFRAFAHHRLHAQALDSADIGLDNLSRGTLIHGVLELFWKQVESQQQLLSLPAEEIDSLLTTVTLAALDNFQRRQRIDLPPALKGLELARLVRMARQWLVFERERPPFCVVACEMREEIEVGPLRIRTQIDRIDRLDGGEMAIIDYKTGDLDPQQWLDARITEPQLPVYCRTLPRDQIGAVLLARVRARKKESGFYGLARDPDNWPGLRKNQEKILLAKGWDGFAAVLAHWDEALPTLGAAFVAGDAAINPLDLEKTCKHCDLTTLCRIHESPRQGAGEGDDE